MAAIHVRDVGDFIRQQRRGAQISLRQLARQAGVSNPYLSQIERGLRRPSAEILQQIAKALRISAEVLYVQAGILEEREGGEDLIAAVHADDSLTERQKQVIIDIYDAFRRENAVAAVSGIGELFQPERPEPAAPETSPPADATATAADAGPDAVEPSPAEAAEAAEPAPEVTEQAPGVSRAPGSRTSSGGARRAATGTRKATTKGSTRSSTKTARSAAAAVSDSAPEATPGPEPSGSGASGEPARQPRRSKSAGAGRQASRSSGSKATPPADGTT